MPLKKGLLAIEDKQDEAEQEQDDDIEDTNSDPILYDWDDVTNKGKRLKPPGRWVICQRQEKDRASGFMKCFWETDAGEEEAKIMDMTIYEYEKVEELSCKACMKKPAAMMKKPAVANTMKKPCAATKKKKLDPKIRHREHSKIYHRTLNQAINDGHDESVGKQKARDAAKKHIEFLISQL